MHKLISTLALASVSLLAQNKPATETKTPFAPPTPTAPVIDEAHQNKVLKLNNRILLLENAIQKQFGDQIKEIDALKQQIGQELAGICGEKFTMQMNGDTAVCVAKPAGITAPKTPPKP